MHGRLISFLMIIPFLISCNKSDENDKSDYIYSDLIIKAGFMCGWGAGEDSLEISGSGIKYIYYVPAQSQLPKIKVSRSLTDSEWINIQNAIDIDEFLNLNYNACNICVDGCDEWISVQNKQVNHQIRYSRGLQIESIKKLQDLIAAFKAEFHPG
jgi:hypothetical protein